MDTPESENQSAMGPHQRLRDVEQPSEPNETGRPTGGMRRILLGVVTLVVIAAGVFGYWYLFMRGIVVTDDARLSGYLVDLSPEISGRLVAVLVHEGQFAHRGDPVFRLDSASQQAALAEAEADLASAKANLAVSRAKYDKTINGSRPEEISAAEALVKRLQSEENLARLQLERMTQLITNGVVAQEELDRAQATYESARENRENAAQNLSLVQHGSRKEDIEASEAEVALAQTRVTQTQAALDRARSDLDRYCVVAPADGWVVRRWLDPGDMPQPGQPVASMFDPSTLQVNANIEEKYLGKVAVGDLVDIRIDAYPNLHLKGQVKQILRATNSEFSLIPAEGVSGTFIKVTQRVPLRISIEAPPELYLGPGLSAEVHIHVGSASARRVRGLVHE